MVQKLLPCGPTGTSSGNCQEMESGMVWACHMPLENHPSGRLREEMLNGQHYGVDILAHARTAHNGFLQTRLEEDLC